MILVFGSLFYEQFVMEHPASPVACGHKTGRRLFFLTQRAFNGQSEPKKFNEGPGLYEKSLVDETWHLIDERKMPPAD
jgi:hypothetical protein